MTARNPCNRYVINGVGDGGCTCGHPFAAHSSAASKLTEFQIKFLRECASFAICRLHGYPLLRLGGHGDSPLRYSWPTEKRLRELCYLEFGSPLKASERGRNFLATLP